MTPLRGAAVLLLFSGWLCAQETPSSARVQGNVMVPMRDNVRLATDVYLPGDGRFPVILCRTPYDKSGERGNGAYYSAHGYVYVAQDTRGRYASEGTWKFLVDDARDGEEAVNWIARQPWSNGKVGTIGTSYVGGTQHALALRRPGALVTSIPVDAVSNPGRHGIRNGGAFELRFWNWVLLNSARGSRASKDPETQKQLQEMADNRRKYLMNLPLRKGTTPLRLSPESEDWLTEAMRHGGNDEFWDFTNIVDHADRYKDMPVYLVGGWYDSWSINTIANYTTLTKAIEGPVYLLMGPWIHGQQGQHAHGQVEFGPDAAIPDPQAWRLEWYDHWMKGVENKVGKEAPFATKVRLFTMGGGDGHRTPEGLLYHGGRWRDETQWPPAGAKPTPYYFIRNGALTTTMPTTDRSQTSYVFDPKNPVPTIGGNISSGDGILLQGGWDQRGGPHVWNAPDPLPLSARNDVLMFRTNPLPEDVEVTGEIQVQLWATSTAFDTDFTAKLIDVYPPSADFPGGFDLNITDGILRARYRDSAYEETLMDPGTVYTFTIKLYPTSNVFRKGHRIRVDLSSSNFPRFDINPNTGEPLNDNRRFQPATNTIFHDHHHPSHIVLPIVPK
ncbi:MAG TPA: CocE/NonD family hydrolase [Planctomycetota bacterium]|nr:CocE/NonD family hydrolase [Planctomycetota bacterium]